MGKVDDCRLALRGLPGEQWCDYLVEHSGLPGPRGNIELGLAFAEEADRGRLDEALASGEEYLTFCGAIGLGRLLADEARDDDVRRLRDLAGDERWRVREGVAMALQRLGDVDGERLHALVLAWADDADPLVQRAAAAGICEPRLLTSAEAAAVALEVCRRTTDALAARPAEERKDPRVRTLRQGLGYCWSVAIAADPTPGLAAYEVLRRSAEHDADLAWIVRENAAKKRLARLLA